MKRILKSVGGAASLCALLATIGCSNIRDYSVNSYQGVMPSGDFRPSGSVVPTMNPNTPKPSVPVQSSQTAPPFGATSGFK